MPIKKGKNFNKEKIIIIFIFFFILIFVYKTNVAPRNAIQSKNIKIFDKKCYYNFGTSKIKIIHIIITRFLLYITEEFSKMVYREDYILNGIRVMKKYLLPSLESQSCKNFIWILIIGNSANITQIKSLLNLNNSFESKVIYAKNLRKYLSNITKGFDVLITTRIDYDDRIYYDAVNDVRKSININRPMIVYGYNRGFYYFEFNDKYYDFYSSYKNEGAIGIFLSLITVLNKVNDTYNIFQIGNHVKIRKELLEKYKSYGIKRLNYEPCIFNNGTSKFVYVRHNYSLSINQSRDIPKKLKPKNFNLDKFYGK